MGRDDFFSPDERKSDRKALLPNPMQPLAEFIEMPKEIHSVSEVL